VTHCIHAPASDSIGFWAFGRQAVVDDFNGGQIVSEGGALLQRETEKRLLKLVERFGAGSVDPRVVGAADRAVTLKWLAVARGVQPRRLRG